MRSGLAAALLAVCGVAPLGASTQPATTQRGPVQVGVELLESYGSPHPYPPSSSRAPVWSDVIHVPDATYISVHFARFEVGPGDRVVVRSPDGTRERVYTRLGKGTMGRTAEGFWAIHINGDTAIVELYSSSQGGGFGYEIDRIARGSQPEEIAEDSDRSLCGVDDSDWARCYAATNPLVYDTSRAVVRLLIGGTGGCTGWLIGCEGHVMTNQHCVANAYDAANTDFELMAEGPTCATDCSAAMSCPGHVVADTSELIRVDWDLDYALLQLPTNPTDTYGYLRLRPAGAVEDEQIYIPQHPVYQGKRIALHSTAPADESGLAEVYSLTQSPCHGGDSDTGYFADTNSGSSGSPVIAADDHLVVALHHCGGCPNRGVPIDAIIDHLGDDLPACAVCDVPGNPVNVSATATSDNEITIGWQHGIPAASAFVVRRSLGSCPQAEPEAIATSLTGTTFADTTVSGGTTYSYTVSALDATGHCESDTSSCVSVNATGACTRAPTFQGLDAVITSYATSCQLDLSWSAATPHCGSDVVYNVYRSSDPEFQPGSDTLVASCLTETGMTDLSNLVDAIEYHYVVRAEDRSGNGDGPCTGGNQETNLAYRAATVVGPLHDETLVFGAEVGDPQPLMDGVWSVSTARAHSGTFSYHSGYHQYQCDALTLPSTLLAPDESSDLSFLTAWDIEPGWDGGVVEVSADGGPWTPLALTPQYPGAFRDSSQNSCGYPEGNPAFTGSDALADLTFQRQYTANLGAFNGGEISVRWRFSTDQSYAMEGWYIDDITLTHAATPSACTTVIGCDPTFAGITSLVEAAGPMQGAHLEWDPATACAGLALHYRVYHGLAAGSVDWSTPVTATSGTAVDLYGMAPGEEHCFGVRAFEGPAMAHDDNTDVLCLTGTATMIAGDTDVDTDVDNDDMVQLVAVAFGAADMGTEATAADVDRSGTVDAGDAASEVRYLNGGM